MKLSIINKAKSILFLLAIVSIILPACKKSFLEITPKGHAILSTTSDYDLALNSLDLVNINANGQIPMGDEIVAMNPFFSTATLRNQRLFRWEADIYQPGEPANEMTQLMSNIYLYNTIINEVLQSTGGTDSAKNSILGEALAGRAFCNFMLINYYGKPYVASTATTDPGYPIVTEADVTKQSFQRASVQEVYDFLINDLITAIPKLPKIPTWRLRMSRAAAEAILAKVYMYMGKYSDAKPLLDNAFADLSNSATPIKLYNLNTDFAPGGPLQIGWDGYPQFVTVAASTEVVFGKQNYDVFANTYDASAYQIMLSPATVALYGSSDGRNTFFSNTTMEGNLLPAGLKVRKYPGFVNIAVNLPDMYLLRAECKARTNDLPGAVADLQTLRQNRMPAADAIVPAAVANDKTALIKFTYDERIREMSSQGERWFDMRRLSVDPEFSSLVKYTHTLYNDAGAVQETYTLKPERLTMRFPQFALSQNPGMQDNP